MNIAILPARGGSKRIPRKNVREFCGRPMIAWPIGVAQASGLFDHIVVSTDDAEIAEAARLEGAEVPFIRPDKIADDHSNTTDVVVHALAWAGEAGWPVEAACCIYPTAAFVSVDDLREARRLLQPGVDYSFAAVRYAHPPQRGFVRAGPGYPKLLQSEFEQTRTQDLPPVYYDAGQFYWGTHGAWAERRPFFGARTRFVELPVWRAQDIDREEDWKMAEQLFASGRQSGG